MIGYAARRLVQTVPTILVMSMVIFGIMQLIPGGPMAALAFNSHQSYAAKLAIIHRWGLDLPVYLQYFRWMGAMFTGDWQNSFFLEGAGEQGHLRQAAGDAAPDDDRLSTAGSAGDSRRHSRCSEAL